MKIDNTEEENLHMFWTTYDVIKSYKKTELHAFYRKYIFGKTILGMKLTHSLIKVRENSFFQLVIWKFSKQDNNDQWL